MGDVGRVDALVSYHYYADPRVMMQLLDTGRLSLIGDSGAYSAHASGAAIELGAYAYWLDQWLPHLAWAASLDVIGDPVASLRNWRLLRAMDLDTVPTVHAGADLSTLDALPAYSADSSGLLTQAIRYGELRLFDPFTGTDRNMELDGREVYAHGQMLRRVYGVDPAEIQRSHGGNWQTLVRVAAESAQQYAAWLQRRHRVQAPALLADRAPTVGTRVHVVATDPAYLLAAVGVDAPTTTRKRGSK